MKTVTPVGKRSERQPVQKKRKHLCYCKVCRKLRKINERILATEN